MARIKVSQMGPKEKAARAKASKKNNSSASGSRKKAEANKCRSKLGLKKGDKRDASHQAGGGCMKKEGRASNRSRGGKAGNRAAKAAGGRKSSRKGVKNVKR